MPSAGIFVIQPDGGLVRLTERAYDSERILQELLARYPDILAGDDGSGDRMAYRLWSRSSGAPTPGSAEKSSVRCSITPPTPLYTGRLSA